MSVLKSHGNQSAVFDSSPPGLAAGGTHEDTAAIKANIIQDVQGRLLQAKRETEQKVAAELKFLHNAMHEMDQRLDMLNQRLEEVQMPQSEMLEDTHVIQSLAKVEQQWGKELGKLKTELHQMIFAHNHNADLMKHQKDTLDKIRHDSLSRSPGSGATQISNARSMLASADARIKAIQANFQKMDPLVPRVTALELRLHHWHAAGGLSGPPAMGAPPLGAYGFEPRPVPNPPDYEATVESPDDEENEEEDEEEDDNLGALRGILGKAIDASSAG